MTETIRSKRPGPCKDCPDRVTACSDHCRKPEYLAWREAQARIKKAKEDYRQPTWARPEMDPGRYRDRKKIR